MAILVRELRDASDEIPDPVDPERQTIELSQEEWLSLYNECAAGARAVMSHDPVMKMVRIFGIPAIFLALAAFCGAIFERTIHYKTDARLNEAIAREQGEWIKFESEVSQSNFRIQQLEQNLSQLQSSKSKVVPGPTLKDQQVDWINLDTSKLVLQGKLVDSIRMEVRSSPVNPSNAEIIADQESRIQKLEADELKHKVQPRKTGNGVANSSTMDSAKPVQVPFKGKQLPTNNPKEEKK